MNLADAPTGPCECFRKVADNYSSWPDGRKRCHLCGHEWDARAWTNWMLAYLREQLALQHPDALFIVDAGAVWLRSDGKDLGIYSKTIDGQIVYCVMDGHTVLSRPTPQ